MEKVESSMISHVDYNNGDLSVIFNNGNKYIYRNVPSELYEQMLLAESKGQFFNANIRDNFSWVQEQVNVVRT